MEKKKIMRFFYSWKGSSFVEFGRLILYLQFSEELKIYDFLAYLAYLQVFF